jgi:hypothetical protein
MMVSPPRGVSLRSACRDPQMKRRHCRCARSIEPCRASQQPAPESRHTSARKSSSDHRMRNATSGAALAGIGGGTRFRVADISSQTFTMEENAVSFRPSGLHRTTGLARTQVQGAGFVFFVSVPYTVKNLCSEVETPAPRQTPRTTKKRAGDRH